VKVDYALQEGQRGARKIIVTEVFEMSECEATTEVWEPPSTATSRKCPVQVAANFEMAVFNHTTSQDRHYHAKATEIYTLLEGSMEIEVDGKDLNLLPGDSCIVNPFAVHLVKSSQVPFLCQVVAVNSAGVLDKYIC